MENKNSRLPVIPSDYPAAPLDLDYVLEARVLANDSPTNGNDLNGVHYTLSSPNNLSVSNQRLNFSVTGSADLIIPTNLTNLNGVLDAGLTNEVPQMVQLLAWLAADPSV